MIAIPLVFFFWSGQSKRRGELQVLQGDCITNFSHQGRVFTAKLDEEGHAIEQPRTRVYILQLSDDTSAPVVDKGSSIFKFQIRTLLQIGYRPSSVFIYPGFPREPLLVTEQDDEIFQFSFEFEQTNSVTLNFVHHSKDQNNMNHDFTLLLGVSSERAWIAGFVPGLRDNRTSFPALHNQSAESNNSSRLINRSRCRLGPRRMLCASLKRSRIDGKLGYLVDLSVGKA